MGNYIHKCELCGETFDLYKGDGWGESYIKEGTMLPSTRYVCMKCINKRKENKNDTSIRGDSLRQEHEGREL